ncbi:MAG: hypothetical protein JSR33_02765 [Proteobacteria bacterium]|nr:hypothetical protein [Pseudomonadota bacterium]
MLQWELLHQASVLKYEHSHFITRLQLTDRLMNIKCANWFKLIIFSILIFGIYASYKTSFGIISINSDVVDTGLLWQGVLKHGWGFIKTWNYNYDNWLLSLFPIHFILFEVFGDHIKLILWFGYLVFLANILICCWIAYELGAKLAVPAIAILLLYSNYFWYLGGLITFPITHNSTNLYGLICLLLIIKWTKKPRYLYSLLILVFFIIAGISDPWFLSTYGVPILLTQIYLIKEYINSTDLAKASSYLIIAILFSFAAIATKLFGLLEFSSQKFIVVFTFKNLLAHICNYVKYLGLIFNLLPGRFNLENHNQFWPSMISFTVMAILAITFNCKFLKVKDKNLAELNYLFTNIFSILLVSCSFILLYIPKSHFNDFMNARYLINIPFFIIMTICIVLEKYWNRFNIVVKIAAFAIGFLYLITSCYSSNYLWWQKIDTDKNGYYNLLSFLQQNHLNYGYADYWQANIITWIAHQQVLIRPLTFYDKTGEATSNLHLQSSELWYQETDLPKEHTTTFIIVQKENSQCQDQTSCAEKISQQFGKPEKILTYHDEFIMVWNHPLLSIIQKLPKKY